MPTTIYKFLEEVGMADFVFRIDDGQFLKLYEQDEQHYYSRCEISSYLNTNLWDYVVAPFGEIIFYCLKESGFKRNVDAEAYAQEYNIKEHFYGNVLVMNGKHFSYAETLSSTLALTYRKYKLESGKDFYAPVTDKQILRECKPANGNFYQLEELQKMVGGYIELVNINEDYYIVCHEEELLHLRNGDAVTFNNFASIMAQKPIAGSAVLILKSHIQ